MLSRQIKQLGSINESTNIVIPPIQSPINLCVLPKEAVKKLNHSTLPELLEYADPDVVVTDTNAAQQRILNHTDTTAIAFNKVKRSEKLEIAGGAAGVQLIIAGTHTSLTELGTLERTGQLDQQNETYILTDELTIDIDLVNLETNLEGKSAYHSALTASNHSGSYTHLTTTTNHNYRNQWAENFVIQGISPTDDADDYNLDARTPEIRKQANTELASVTAHLGLSDVQTLSFLRSRQGCEIAAKKAQRATGDHPVDAYLDVDPYHAGLSKKRRRAIENKLKSGDIDGVLSTNALELGIDIGSVDATVLGGYPGKRQSFWQQLGRAGRGTADALSVFIPRDDAMDQYILDNPSYLLEDDVEDEVVSLDNNSVYAKHVLCASNEIRINSDDIDLLGEASRLKRALSVWRDAGRLKGNLDIGAQYAGPPRPETQINMYSTTDTQYDVRCVGDGTIDIEPVQKERAYRDFHPGALFMHDGVQYEVKEIDEDPHQPIIEVKQVSTNEYTITSSDERVHDVSTERTIRLNDDIALHAGMGTVDIAYTQYHRIPIYGVAALLVGHTALICLQSPFELSLCGWSYLMISNQQSMSISPQRNTSHRMKMIAVTLSNGRLLVVSTELNME